MNKVLGRTKAAALVVLPLAFAVQNTNAAMVTDWGYEVHNTFTDVTSSGTTGPAVSGAGTNQLVWGSGPQSSISIDAVLSADSGLLTNTNTVAGGTFVHENRAIPVTDRALNTFSLTSVLDLTAAAPEEYEGEEFGPNTIVFNSFFTETPNNGTCITPADVPCDDIFSLTNGDLGSFNGDSYDIFGGSFTFAGYAYSVFLEISDMVELFPAECTLIGAEAGCVGFRTREGLVNDFESRFRIEATAVPEPGTLALLGLGLVGLGVTRRRSGS